MTNDNRTNEPTPEQIIEDALRNSYASGSALARLIVSDLHAHGMLSGGAPLPSTDSLLAAFADWHESWWKNEPNVIAKANAQDAFFAGWDACGAALVLPSSGVDEDG